MHEHTFVVCAYKDSEFLEACIQSLKKQTVASDIILYTSTPSSKIEALCQQYQLSYYTNVGGSIGKDWNQALSYVDTAYVTIAHQDDIYLPDYTEKILAQFKRYPNSLITFSDYAELREQTILKKSTLLFIKRLMLKTMRLLPKSRFWRHRILAFGNPICCPAVTYNMRLLAQFRFDEDMKVSLDWLAWHDIAKYKGRFNYVADILMYHRIHEASETTNTIADNKRSEEDFKMYTLFWPKWVANLLMKQYVKSQKSNEQTKG